MMSDKSQITSFTTRALEWYSEFDEGVSGKPAKWVNDSNENLFSAMVLILSLALAVNTYITEMDALYLDVSEWKNIAYCLIAALVAFFAWSTSLSVVLKGTFTRSKGAPLLGLLVAWTTYFVVSGLSYFVIVGAEWDVIWANRATLFLGIEINTGVVNPDFENQTWRLWPSLILSTLIICSALGTTKETNRGFAIKLGILWAVCMFYVWFPAKLNYNPDGRNGKSIDNGTSWRRLFLGIEKVH